MWIYLFPFAAPARFAALRLKANVYFAITVA
jgi:hypothetical protein